MSKSLQWVIGIGVTLTVIAVIFATIWPLVAPRADWSGYSMMGPGHMMGGGGMLGGWSMPLFGLGMLLWPLLIIGLVVIGAVWLVRSAGTPATRQLPTAHPGPACAHCGHSLQSGWKACPNCGERV